MSVRANNLFADGFTVNTLGVQSGEAPNTLPAGQFAWAVNAQSRTGYMQPRPGWAKRILTGDEIVPGLYQGASVFQRTHEVVLSVGGRIYSIDINSYLVTERTDADLNSSTRRRAWFCEAEDFMLIQDGQSACWIYDGTQLYRSNTSAQQVPTGMAMCYALGRLWVTLPDGRSYVGSDIVYGSSGTPAYGKRDAILYFKENELLNGGGAFGIPFLAGPITAMVSMAQTDTSLGQGPMQVFTTNGTFSINAPFDRALWAQVNYPIQSAALLSNGALSDWATTNVNGDIWYRASDGIRSYQVARRDFGTWTNTPLSHEVSRAIDGDTKDLLAWCSSALFDSRLLATTSPYSNYDYGIVHRGLAVLDFTPNSSLTDRESSPIWDGQWCGLGILQIVSGIFEGGVERCFIIALNSDNEIELWEVTRNSLYDNDGEDKLIQWQIEAKSFTWDDKGNSLKQLEFADIFYDLLQDEVTFNVSYRPDQEPNWQAWHSWISCAVSQTCDNTTDPDTACSTVPPTLGPQYRVRHRLPVPPDDCDEVTMKPYRRGFEFQPRFVITGPCRIQRFRLWASDVPEDTMGGCEDDSACKILEACLPDTLAYSIATAENRPT